MKKANSLRLTWERLGAVDLWSGSFLFFSAAVYGVLTFLMDFLRTQDPTWLWAITYTVSLAFAVALAWAAKRLVVEHIAKNLVAITNVVLALVIGGLKNVSVACMSMALGLEQNVDLVFRFAGGMVIGGLLITSFAAITGARGAHATALRKLAAIQNELLGSRENLELVLAEELERLQAKSRETVLPKIRQISELLGDDSKTSEVIAELGETVRTRVRPLMEEIAKSAKVGFSKVEGRPELKIRVLSPKAFSPRPVIRPIMTVAYTMPGVTFMTLYFQGLTGAIAGIGATLLFGCVLALMKFVVPDKSLSRSVSFGLLFFVSVLAAIPSLFLIGLLPLDAHQSILVPLVAWALFVMTNVGLNPLVVLDLEREKLEDQIESENSELAKEITIFEQRLWVFKRRWLFMLHGTVQSALTAALTRLQTFSETDPYQASLVRADLERAEKALQQLPETEIDFTKAATELRDAWAGVCSISVDVDMRADRALKNNQGSAYCVNEIMKEAIGNAVRHGSATAVRATITRIHDDILEIQIQNDGTAPARAWKKGIGSRMLDDITLDWSLSRSGRLTTLKARLPL